MAYILDTFLGKGRTDKVKAQTIGTLINGATAKTTPVDADNVPISDSAASHILKKVTWANIKATLKTYFDTLYSTMTDAPSDGKTYGRKNAAWDAVDEAEVASAIHAATTQNPPLDADEIGFTASGATWALRKVTLTQFKAFLKTYLDTLYQATGLALLKASNLSDLANTATARSNLGLGTAATGTSQSVTVSAPLATSQAFSVIGAAAPTLSIAASTTLVPGSMSAADKTKLDGIAAGAQPGTVTSVTGSSPIESSGGTTPAISIPAATNLSAGHATAAHIQAIEANTLKVTNATHTGDVSGSGALTIEANKVTLGKMATLPGQTLIGSSSLRMTLGGAPDASFDGSYYYKEYAQVYTFGGVLTKSGTAGTHSAYTLDDAAFSGTVKFIAWNLDTGRWCIGQLGEAAAIDATDDKVDLWDSAPPRTVSWDNGSGTEWTYLTPQALTRDEVLGLIRYPSWQGIGDLVYGSAEGQGHVDLPIGATNDVLLVSGGVPAWSATQAATLSAPLATSQAFRVVGSAAPTISISAATTGAAGSMSAADKTKVDALTANWTLIDAGAYTAEPASTSVITMSDTSDMKVGLPLQYIYGGVTYRGWVVTVTANTSIAIRGAPLVTGGGSNLTALYVGLPERIVAMSLFVAGAYGDGTDNTLLVTDMKSPMWWSLAKAYLVGVEATHITVDTGTQPVINIKIAGDSALSTGITLTGSQSIVSAGVALDTAKYDINMGEALDVACTTAGGTGDAANLTVQLVFVLE